MHPFYPWSLSSEWSIQNLTTDLSSFSHHSALSLTSPLHWSPSTATVSAIDRLQHAGAWLIPRTVESAAHTHAVHTEQTSWHPLSWRTERVSLLDGRTSKYLVVACFLPDILLLNSCSFFKLEFLYSFVLTFLSFYFFSLYRAKAEGTSDSPWRSFGLWGLELGENCCSSIRHSTLRKGIVGGI